MEKTTLRGVNFTVGSMDEIAEYIMERAAFGESTAVFTPNSEIVQACIDAPSLYSVINSAEVIIPDGIGIIKAAKILGLPIKERVPGIELGERILSYADDSLPVFFLGGKPGIADAAAEKMQKKYKNLVIAGTGDGYFEKTGNENDSVIERVVESGAKILFVCFGAPAQEKWIAENRARLPDIRIFMGLGGSLDIYSGISSRAPEIFCRTGLEWLYRLLRQPSRIGRMMKLPKFYFGTLIYKLREGK